MNQPNNQGLTGAEAAERLAQCGPNALPAKRGTPLWLRFLHQFRSPLIAVLLFALAFDLVAWFAQGADGWPLESAVIGTILLLNATLGTFQEFRSEQALKHLRALAAPHAWVLRDDDLQHIPSDQIVPGDLLRVEAGERIPADGELLDAFGFLVDESVLTGESVPVDKAAGDSVFSGTLLVRGTGRVRVTETGTRSSMGKMATMLGTVALEKTPLERRLHALGTQIARWVGGLAILLAVLGVLAEGIERFEQMVLFAVALAVAAVPEGMPAVVTLALALGVQRMARRKAVVRRLSAVEALGSVTVIATDKTGTLTENRMQVQALDVVDPDRALWAMVLANDADDEEEVGDPLELGLLEYARAQGLDVAELKARPRVDNRPFDSAWKYMRATVPGEAGEVSWLKGAPEVLLERAALPDEERARWQKRADQAARQGYRVLALATASGREEEGVEFLGLVHLWDPPRAEVPDAILQARQAGVRVLMVTGDHPGTASAVAEKIGIEGGRAVTGDEIERMSTDELRQVARTAHVFARVSPQHKLALVEALQADKQIVAMTGDGVNDAAALKRADVGVAMGQRGSDVAREVSDLVLLDDNFATIVGAIEEGRNIYENIQSFIRFLFSTNIALVVLVVLGAIGAWVGDLREPDGALLLPLTALQLLWINFLGDGPPALALALDRNHTVMSRPPRAPESPLLDPPAMRFVVVTGILKAAAGGLILFLLPLYGVALTLVRTAVFLYEALVQLAFVYPSRKLTEHPERNTMLHVIVGLGVGLQFATLYVPQLRMLLGLEPLEPWLVGLVLGAVVVTWLVADGINRLLIRPSPPVVVQADEAPA